MGRRDGRISRLKKELRDFQNGVAGAVDPFSEIPQELRQAYLYATTGGAWWNGFDGLHSGRVHIHRDGHHTSHAGACAIEPAEDDVTRMVRQAGLDRYEAELARDMALHFRDSDAARARRLGWAERTTRRRHQRIEEKLRDAGYSERHLEGA